MQMKMLKKFSDKRAFTIIELMVTVAVIAILASIVTFTAISQQKSSRDAARDTSVTLIAEALEKYHSKHNEYPSVASLANKPISVVKQKLGIIDEGTLRLPLAATSAVPIVSSNPSTTQVAYIASTNDPAQNTKCQSQENWYCDKYTLQYKKEGSNDVVTVKGRHNDVEIAYESDTPAAIPVVTTFNSFENEWIPPDDVAVDAFGDVYVADGSGYNMIWRISPSGVRQQFAGSGAYGYVDGKVTYAQFQSPTSIAVKRTNSCLTCDHIYIGEYRSIRKSTPSAAVTTLVSAARNEFNGQIYGIAVGSDGTVYASDSNSHRIRKVSANGATVTTLAGSGAAGNSNGTGTAASFNFPMGVAVDSDNNVYVADYRNNVIRKITAAGVVTTLAGSGVPGNADGIGLSAQFYAPYGIAVDTTGNVYVSDSVYSTIRKITPNGLVTTLAGSNGFEFSSPYGIDIDSASRALYVADTYNYVIKKVQQ